MTHRNARHFRKAAAARADGDFKVAFPLMLECAEQDQPKACFLLALMYLNGEGVVPNPSEYKRWLLRLQQLAEAGDPDAQWELNCKYRWGNHFEENRELANMWLQRSAEGRNSEAALTLFYYFRNGAEGFKKDARLAEEWFSRALAEKHPEALYLRGVALLSRQEDSLQGLVLLKESASTGFLPSIEALERIGH